MREILFRGIDSLTGKWVQGDLLHISSGCIIYHGSQTESEIKENAGAAIELLIDEISVVKPKTVGQFTGVTDKNGVKIFEGDILSCGKKASLYKNFPIEIIGIVFFHQGKYEVETKKVINKHFSNQSSIFFGVQPMDWIHLPEFHKSEIIGNIHENPELLK